MATKRVSSTKKLAIGKKIKHLRKSKGLSQQDLEEAIKLREYEKENFVLTHSCNAGSNVDRMREKETCRRAWRDI